MCSNINIFVLLTSFLLFNCENQAQQTDQASPATEVNQKIQVGAEQTEQYFPLLENKIIGMVVNQTSTLGNTHVVDSMVSSGLQIKTIFAPEHGFRGQADAGEKIVDGKDARTGIPIISLYGKKKKPSAADLAGIDILVFDIQDVGARFYTYISSMHYVMQSCAELGIPFMVLDRPNPNGHYVDGPVLDTNFGSFVGMHEVPTVHGMTIGEYAQMVNEEGWLGGHLKCDLRVIKCKNYSHDKAYILPIKPSPNLPNNRAIYLYPSLCFFEGTTLSAGRGTEKQFQLYGSPAFKSTGFQFTPISRAGAKYPKHQDKVCNGFDLSTKAPEAIRSEARLNLSYLIEAYGDYPNKEDFFIKNNFIDKLAGNAQFKEQIKNGLNEAEIRASWEPTLSRFKAKRKKYLLYP